MAIENISDLSFPSQAVLCLIATSVLYFVWRLLVFIFRILRKILKFPKHPTRPSRHKVIESSASSSSFETRVPAMRHTTAPSKPVVHKAKTSKSKKQDEGKITENPLYIVSLKDHRDAVQGFGWSHCGSCLASACDDRCVRVFSFSDKIDKGIVSRQINISAEPIDVGFLTSTPREFVVLCKGMLNTASLFFYSNEASETGGISWTCTRTVDKIFGMAAPLKLSTVKSTIGSKILIVACSERTEAKIFDHHGVAMSTICPNSFLNYDLAVSYNAQLASIATFTADAKLWELQFSREGTFRGSPKVMDLRGHKSKVNTVAISMDASRAVSVSQDGVMKVWNTDVDYHQDEDPRCLLTVKLDLPEAQNYHRLAFGPEFALAAVFRNTLHFLDMNNGSVIRCVESAHDSYITSIDWCPVLQPHGKGKVRVLASSGRDKRVRLWAHPQDIS